MRIRYSLPVILTAFLTACGGEIAAPPPPVPAPLLRDVVIPNLPSPYYHFEYDQSGRVSAVSFASGLRMYDVTYDGARITTMTNSVNGDTLRYFYDDAGRVSAITYDNSSGVVYVALFFTYDGQKLTGIERDRRVDAGFIFEKTTSLMYDPDGNLLELREHHPAIEGQQDETTTVDRFERYDDKVNVDGFSLIHDEFFDHLVLLPGVRFQTGNPARVTHTGDGINYVVDYTYTYDDSNRPLAKDGDLTLLNGPDTGRKFQTRSEFSYY